jgi:hypothetical protein
MTVDQGEAVEDMGAVAAVKGIRTTDPEKVHTRLLLDMVVVGDILDTSTCTHTRAYTPHARTHSLLALAHAVTESGSRVSISLRLGFRG